VPSIKDVRSKGGVSYNSVFARLSLIDDPLLSSFQIVLFPKDFLDPTSAVLSRISKWDIIDCVVKVETSFVSGE